MASTKNLMDSVKEGAIRVYDGMITVFPQFSLEVKMNIKELILKYNGCYAMNNSTVCFVSNDEVFVAPYTRNIIGDLQSAGFYEKCFNVPFSNGDYPKSEELKWNFLREKACKSYEEYFVEDCEFYCDEHHIGTIKEETLQNCFEMPSTGVRVMHPYFEDCYYPIINSTCFDSKAADSIGRFCTNNGKVVFVYRNGKTYVAKGYNILNELCYAGYKGTSLFVPFSSGEKILDDALKERWESIV